jgi:hypothetical protein
VEKRGGREMERGGNGGGGGGGGGKNSFIVAFVWIGVSVFVGLGAEEGERVAPRGFVEGVRALLEIREDGLMIECCFTAAIICKWLPFLYVRSQAETCWVANGILISGWP